MKNTNHIIAVLILLGALSCARMEETGLEQVTFQAIHGDVLPSKTVLQSDGSIFWSPGDEINLFYGPTGASVLVSTSDTETAQTSFAGSLSVLPDNQTEFWAVYPYSASNAFDGSAVTLSLPEVQTGRDSTFASGLFVSLAKSTDYTLQFYNLCGGVKFSVSNQGIQYVTFKGNNNEVLAGQVKVTFDEDGKPQVQEVLEGQTELRINAPEGGFEVGKWYYIVSLPVSLSTGYTMAFYANAAQPIIRSVETPVTIKRSMWGKLPFSDNPVPNNEIWYTSTDGNIVEPFMESAFVDVELISNTYENGMGVMKFNKPLGTINASAFTARHTLETITIPYVADLNGNPFTQCENLRAIYGLSAAEENRFWIVGNELRCIAEAGLSSITIPEGVTKLGRAAFFTCYALAEIILPSSLIHISSSVFGYCTSLTQLTLPESVRLIESNAFYRNNQLKSLTVLRETPPTIAGSDILQNSDNCYIYVPAESVQAYKAAYGWSDYAERIYPIGANPSPTSKYLTFTSEGTTKISLSNEGGNSPVLYYSNDATTWTKWDYNELTFTSDTPLYICGDNPDGVCRNETTYCTFVTAGDFFSVTGDATSLVNKSQSIDVVPPYCFTHLFQDCALIKEGPEIPTTNLGVHCYEHMFYGCTGLEVAPSLPATVLSNSCYEDMFNGCRSLAAAPNLPATALAEHCYKGMFQGCTNMSSAPELPATQLSTSCYQWMFCECTNLINCPELPATSLADDCYFGMFMLCPNITSAPVLPATTMSEGCYHLMFDGCTSLRSAPDLPATALADYCYECMFMGCTALETIQSVLPATSLFNACYHNMFSGCTSLTAAPDLPASDLTNMCYYGMFEGCRKLSSIKCLATNLDAEDCLNNWLQGVSTTGTFVKAANVEWPTGASGIPEGWTVETAGESAISPSKYLTFNSEGSSTVFLVNDGGNAPLLYYSTDTYTWQQWDYGYLNFTSDNPVYICGNNPDGFSLSDTKNSMFRTQGDPCSISGDIMSLLDYTEDLYAIPNEGCFSSLFVVCYNLTSGPALPATTLSKNCYNSMFRSCTGLLTAPNLPASILANSCYSGMFNGCSNLSTPPRISATEMAYGSCGSMFGNCTSLVTAPDLPAEVLEEACYFDMFKGCTSLTTVPLTLPATTLARLCYRGMFEDCTSLTSAPELPASTLAEYCYMNMFNNCTKLNYVKCLATDFGNGNSSGIPTEDWLTGVSSTGTFVKAANVEWPSGTSGIPEGWAVEEL